MANSRGADQLDLTELFEPVLVIGDEAMLAVGRPIYAGGDDVLAMLPVADLLPAMQRLRLAYAGHEVSLAAVALCNRIIHGYDRVEHAIVFDTVKRDLPILAERVQNELARWPLPAASPKTLAAAPDTSIASARRPARAGKP